MRMMNCQMGYLQFTQPLVCEVKIGLDCENDQLMLGIVQHQINLKTGGLKPH